MGWLGWSEAQALASDVNAIMVGYGGKVSMLRACYGGGEGEAKPAAKLKPSHSRPLAPKMFDAMFGR